jgi:hypothetical protein
MWMACHTQEEIGEATATPQRTIADVTKDFSGLVSENQTAKPAAEHLTDFTIPLYNIWKFKEKSNDVSHFGNTAQTSTIARNRTGAQLRRQTARRAHSGSKRQQAGKEKQYSDTVFPCTCSQKFSDTIPNKAVLRHCYTLRMNSFFRIRKKLSAVLRHCYTLRPPRAQNEARQAQTPDDKKRTRPKGRAR